MNTEPLDVIPLWCFFLLTMAIGMLVMEGGYRFGQWRHVRVAEEKEVPVGAMVASLLGLVAIMLAFTFNLAAGRFDARRQVVLEEANAVGTTYLRARLLPEPQRTEIVELLRKYTELRVHGIAEGKIAEVINQSGELQNQLWSKGVAAAEKNPNSIMTGLFLQSLNETIDLHAKRVFVGLHSRIPFSMWLALFGLTLLGTASIGYQAGLSATRRSPEMPILILAFACVLFLIVDLDRGHAGFLQVSQQSMADVLKSMQTAPP